MRRLLGARLAAAALLCLAAGGRALAANSAAVNIDVSVIASLSVSVDGGVSSTHTVVWNAAVPNQRFASASTAAVVNDTGGRTERWALSTNAESINTAAGPDRWSLALSTAAVGPDEFSVQAVFGSSGTAAGGCPAAAASDWDQSFAPLLTALPVTYTSTVFADPGLNSGGTPLPDISSGGGDGRMFAGSRRALCWRIITPSSTSSVDTQNIQVIVTATP